MNDDSLSRRRFLKALGATSAVVLGAGALGCIGGKTNVDTRPTTGLTYTITGTVSSKFADFMPVAVAATPSLGDYAAPGSLSGIPGATGIDDAGKAALSKNLFYMRPSSDTQIYDVYKDAVHSGAPVIVTTDAALHAYHILFDYALRILEVNRLNAAVTELTDLMLEASLAQLDAGVPALSDLCKRNVAFFAVAKALLEGSTGSLPADVRQLVDAELDLIEAHEGFADSPIFGRSEDYSQYVPRGHYTRNDLLKKYFKAMMWYGRMSFNLYKSTGAGGKVPDKDSTRRAIMITLTLAPGGRAFDLWQSVYDPTVFFVGETDDLSVYDYRPLIKKVYGETVTLHDLTDDDKVLTFIEKAATLKAPKIVSGYLGYDDDKATIKGFRFMGQRFIPDSYMFQELVFDKVGTPGNPRLFPMGLDVMAVLGSKRAYNILDSLGETKYENYVRQYEALKASFAALKAEDWTQNLYWGWLYSLLALLNEKGDGYPTFMKSDAWTDKELNAALGSWAELRHDTILYAKQSYTLASAAMPPQEKPKGYVEPNPELYGRLASLAKMTYDGLYSRGLLEDALSTRLEDLRQMLLKLKDIAEKELTGKALSDEEYDYIKYFGGLLENITTFPPEVASAIESDTDKVMAVVADVHTDVNTGLVLEEGVGYPYHLFVLVPVEGKMTLCRGAAFSYYEFRQPMSDRLTDEAWQAMLKDGRAPELPAWTKSFMA